MKKLSLLLVAVLLVTLLAACGAGGDGSTSQPADPATDPASSAPTEELQEFVDNYQGELPLSPEKVTLKFTTHQGTNASIAIPSNDLPLYQWLEEITNVHIEWEVLPYEEYGQTMSIRLAGGGELPDILNLRDLGNYEQLAQDGIIIPQTELIEKYAYWTNQYMEENPAYRALFTSPDGEIYCIENTVLDSDLGLGVCINQYALERVDMPMPTSVDEFYDTLVAFKEKEGNSTPLFIATKEGVYAMSTWFGVEGVYDWQQYGTIKDGKVVNIYGTPEYKEYVTYMNKLYSEGLINQDYLNAGWDQVSEAIANNETSAVAFWNTYCTWYSDPSPDAQQFIDAGENPQEHAIFVPMDPLKSPSGADTVFMKRSALNGDGMGITTDCPEELQAVAMKWIDFLFASPISLRAQTNGVEGLTYEMNGDEIVKLDPPEGTDWSTWVTEIGGNQPPRAHQQDLEAWHNSWLYDWAYDIDMHQKQFYVDPSIIPIKFTQDEENTYDTLKATLEVYKDENLALFINGNRPLDEWDDFVAELDAMGMTDMIAVLQSRYERQLESMA